MCNDGRAGLLSGPSTRSRQGVSCGSAPTGPNQCLWSEGLRPEGIQRSTTRATLTSSHRCDVAIIGAGFTGLWTAYYLKSLQPDLSVAVIEARHVGFGASGRNGGWCSALFPTSDEVIARTHGADAARAQRTAMRSAVDEVGRVLIEEGIDAGFTKGGTVIAARTPAQRDRLRSSLSADETWLDASQAAERIGVSDLYGATFNPHCATVHPGRAVHGLAAAVEARGVQIFERTAATAFESSRVVTDHSTITATTVLRCTEAYTASLRSTKRRIAPVYSLMIATEPLPPSFWAAAKLHQRETFSDGRHVVIYGQRTADDRIAFGGRGAPYHFGSVIQDRFDHEPTVFASLEVTLREMFPMLDGYAITHRWGGPLGIPRDWMASVEFDRDRKVGSAGGYVGDGVSTTNLAGRTLARLTLGIEDDLTALPWVHHHSPNWEPEPLRWLGINLGTRLAATADSREPNGGLRHQIASAALRRLTGGH